MKVDVHAGVADRASGRAWDADTLALVFSTTKGAAAICVARLVESGALSYDDAVAMHWPEFSVADKGDVTVRQVMSHQAGLPYVEQRLGMHELLEVTPVVEALARQRPLWEPGTAHGYHALTYGWLVGELVRRVDGRSIGTYLAEEVSGPLGLDLWIGLPESEEGRVATLATAPAPTDPEEIALMMQVMGPGTMGFNALTMSGALAAFGGGPNPFNTRELHATEMPAANGITNAASLATMYAATIGEVDGVRLVSDDTMRTMSAEQVDGPDRSLVAESRFALGFMLDNALVPLLGPNAFGHAGAGGSLGQADPDTGVATGYVMNQMLAGIAGDPRPVRLDDAVRSCL
ncbi:serine hydrolase domain-containing protein [Ilumatobacter sp.]|uniref:serine hydrolase domain-containing protein n=1 Tax=Ilumatobacter sp. TaxID=1967498 RepID=UPI003B52239C